LILDGLPPAPRGVPQIEVTFDIDANGILNVSAKDKASNKTQSIRIEGSTGLSKEEVEKMKKDAEIHAAQDSQKKELIEAKNLAENLIYSTEKALKDVGDKITAEMKKDTEEKIDDLKKVKDGDKIDDIKAKTLALQQAAQKIGEILYSKQQQTPPPQEESKDQPPQAEEGEYKEK